MSKNFWVWTDDKGWIHAVHALEGLRPNEREFKEEKLPDNYGTMEYIEEKKRNANFEAQAIRADMLKNKGRIIFNK